MGNFGVIRVATPLWAARFKNATLLRESSRSVVGKIKCAVADETQRLVREGRRASVEARAAAAKGLSESKMSVSKA